MIKNPENNKIIQIIPASPDLYAKYHQPCEAEFVRIWCFALVDVTYNDGTTSREVRAMRTSNIGMDSLMFAEDSKDGLYKLLHLLPKDIKSSDEALLCIGRGAD